MSATMLLHYYYCYSYKKEAFLHNPNMRKIPATFCYTPTPTSSDDGLNLGKTSIANDMTPMCYVVPYFGYGLSQSVEETLGFSKSV